MSTSRLEARVYPPGLPTTLSARANSEAYYEHILEVNLRITTLYATYISAMIGLFVVMHWTRVIAFKTGLSTRGGVLAPIVSLSRFTRGMLGRRLPGFTSVGHALVVLTYVLFNALFMFWRVNFASLSEVGARCGWMAMSNMALLTFLALKNTPLAFITAYSYERLNELHQIAGYTTLIQIILHGSVYTSEFLSAGYAMIFEERFAKAGILAGFAILTLVFSGAVIRRFNYELFYVMHVSMFVILLIAVGLHRPSFAQKTVIVTILIACVWVTDRLIRFTRLVYNSINNEATVYPLPDGGTRIVMKKSIARSRPGKHCYVWLPQIRAFETHPFTIVATEPSMELVVNTYSGFTKDLNKFATANPGASLRVSTEGPYGTFPDPMDFDKVVLVAGGSGATFTFGLATSMLGRMSEESTKTIDFIWSVKGHENLGWFNQHIETIQKHTHAPKLAFKLYLTRASSSSSSAATALPALLSSSSSSSSSSAAASDSEDNTEKKKKTNNTLTIPAPIVPASLLLTNNNNNNTSYSDVEKGGLLMPPTTIITARNSSSSSSSSSSSASVRSNGRTTTTTTTTATNVSIQHGRRPDAEALIREAVVAAEQASSSSSSSSAEAGGEQKQKRILIAACGPDALLRTVRETAAKCIIGNSGGGGDGDGMGAPAAVELHCEQFGW